VMSQPVVLAAWLSVLASACTSPTPDQLTAEQAAAPILRDETQIGPPTPLYGPEASWGSVGNSPP
jgi:hypothetical protein